MWQGYVLFHFHTWSPMQQLMSSNSIIILIIIITRMTFKVLSSSQSHCECSLDECRLSTEVATNLQSKPTDLDCESVRKKWHIHNRHFIITQPESWYSFYRPTEGGKLSRPRHCSKGVQPVPKAVYCSDYRDKHNCWQRDSNPGPLTPKSGMVPLGHWDNAFN